MYYLVLLFGLTLQLVSSLHDTKPCTAAAIFLKSASIESSSESAASTYTIPVTYPCDSSPLPKIEKLKKANTDPFISFYLKRTKRESYFEGSGAEQYDDDEDDDDEDEDEEEEEQLNLEPSTHVIPVLPTPTFELPPPSSYNEIDTEFITSTPTINPTPSSHFNLLHHTDDELVFAVGSGDGPLILSTPIYSISLSSPEPTYSSPPTSSSSPYPTAYLLHPIQKQLLYSGVPHTYTIPDNTFQPRCEWYELSRSSMEPWVEVVGSTLNFFPTKSHVSDYTLQVICQPYMSTAEVYVSVRQRQKSRLHNHEFMVEFGMIRSNLSLVQLTNRVVEEINAALHDSNGTYPQSDLVVLGTELVSYPFRLTYVNESTISNVCPVTELTRIYKQLHKVGGFIHLERVGFSVPDNNQCDNKVVQVVTGSDSGEPQQPPPQINNNNNYQPSIKNQIDRLNGSVGEYLVYHVKEDFCYDPEDGGTRNLNVELRNSDMGVVGEDYWLQFDSKNQEFYGLPMEVQERDFVLVCSDNGGKSANDVLELQVHPPRTPPNSYNTEFNLHFKSIPFTPKAIRKFIEKLQSILSPHIQVNSYMYSNNHVLFKWFNTTNPSTEHEVTEIRNVMLTDDGPVNKKLYEHFTPEFNITVASVIPLKKLLSENNPEDMEETPNTPRYFDFDEIEQHKGDDSDSTTTTSNSGFPNIGIIESVYLTTYIIPSVLIAAMILLALIIACLLSRKNKYTQASTEDDSPNGRVYLKNAKKGVPVIFQDELEEKGFREDSQQGNIYEPPQQPVTPRYTNQYSQQQQSTPTNASSRVMSPQPTSAVPTPRMMTPQPPDYQNSISRSMMRNRGSGSHAQQQQPIPPGAVPVYPGTHAAAAAASNRYNNIDSYAPPPGINYYGIHTSNSGGSGFSGGSGMMMMNTGGAARNPPEHINMAPPPYVPP